MHEQTRRSGLRAPIQRPVNTSGTSVTKCSICNRLRSRRRRPNMDARNSNVFREIHKNTWLKRLSVDNKKVLVGPKVCHHMNRRCASTADTL